MMCTSASVPDRFNFNPLPQSFSLRSPSLLLVFTFRIFEVMSSQLETLPSEIQQCIVEYLDATSPASLTTLGCVSKRLFATVKPFLLRTIRFSVVDISDYNEIRPDRISTAVHEYSQLLQRYNGTSYVQHLIIGGDISHDKYGAYGSKDKGDYGPYQWRQSKISRMDRLALASADGELCDQPDPLRRDVRHGADYSGPDECYRNDYAWKPIAEFITKLPGLKHLIYNYFSQFPPCLLEALHKHRPGCQLHLYSFRMRSAPVLDAYETKLITSPCLKSIRVACKIDRKRGTDFDLNHPGDYAMRHAVVIAPALRRMHVDMYRGGGARRISLEPREKVTTVSPCAPDSGDIRQRLHSLRLFSYAGVSTSRKLLERWMARVDFSELKALGIVGYTEPATMEFLGSDCQFPSLRSLLIRLTLYDCESEREKLDYGKSMKQLLGRLSPLLSLSLSHLMPGLNVEFIAKHHGVTLRRLAITDSKLNEYDLKCLAKFCPHLEYLKLSLPRSWGDASEVALYNALGSIPRLVEVELDLKSPDRQLRRVDNPVSPDNGHMGEFDISDPSDGDQLDEFHNQNCTLQSGFRGEQMEYIKNAYVRDIFMNCALDQNLACAIFRAISAGKPKDIGRPLRQMDIRMTGGRILSCYPSIGTNNHITQSIMTVSKKWQVKRSIRDDRVSDLIAIDCDHENNSPGNMTRNYSTSNVEEVIRRLWPGIEDMSDWKNQWHSFPLAEDNK